MEPATAVAGPQDRPSTVTAACYLLYLIAVTAGISSVGEVAAGQGTLILVGGAMGAAIYTVLGYFCGKGKNPARKLVLLSGALALLSAVFTMSTFARLYSEGFYAARPGWYVPLRLTGMTIQFVGLATAAVLLALPSSGPFFRKRTTPRPPATVERSHHATDTAG